MVQNSDITVKENKVLVLCFTYNHRGFIEDALDGFAMQTTDFPYVCLVMDDASTDGEQDVIKVWMERECDISKAERYDIPESEVIVVPHKTNPTCSFVFYLLKENLFNSDMKMTLVSKWGGHCEYVAICEGDDYWIAPEKLQKQVDFLETHRDYSMCFHKAKVVNEDDVYTYSDIHAFDSLVEKEYSGHEIAPKWMIPTASILFRSGIPFPEDSRFYVADEPLSLQCAAVGRVFCLADEMSVYRKHANGYSQVARNADLLKVFNQELAFIEHFPKFEKELENRLIRNIGLCFYSPYIIHVIRAVYKNKSLIPYLFRGVVRMFVPRIVLSTRKVLRLLFRQR